MKNSNKKGFTLVELVVVIAIIGVLAAILVPSMLGYVKKSRLKTANGNAKTAYNTVSEYIADQETKGELAAASESVAASKATLELSTNGNGSGEVAVQFEDNLGEIGADGKIGGFTVQWRKGANDEIIGQYPNPAGSVEEAQALSWVG